MTPLTQAQRRTLVARGIAILYQLGGDGPIKPLDEIGEQDRKDATTLADALISVWDGLRGSGEPPS